MYIVILWIGSLNSNEGSACGGILKLKGKMYSPLERVRLLLSDLIIDDCGIKGRMSINCLWRTWVCLCLIL